jgi:hypothetical protein
LGTGSSQIPAKLFPGGAFGSVLVELLFDRLCQMYPGEPSVLIGGNPADQLNEMPGRIFSQSGHPFVPSVIECILYTGQSSHPFATTVG